MPPDPLPAKERLQLLDMGMQVTENAIAITDAAGVVLWVNPAFEKVTGYALDEVVGRRMSVFKSGVHTEEFYREMWRTISGGRNWHGEVTNRSKGGELYFEEMTIAPVRDAGGAISHYIAVKQNITERKRLEARLVQAQRLESIGMLASGVAHDLNNILTPILMSIELLRFEMPGGRAHENLEVIETTAKRGAAIVRQLLTFAQGIEGERIEVSATRLVKDVAHLISQTFPRNIVTRVHADPGAGTVMGDPTQLHQVLLNLAVNARDSMPDGGVLTLRAENRRVTDDDAAGILGANAGEFAVITVADAGCGMAPELLDRVFEPFYTTKSRGKGTGLGLSTAHGIVRSHEGFMTVSSVPGKGSEFSVFLPLVKPPAPPVPAKGTPAGGMPSGRGKTLLVVDDEEAILRLVRDVLSRHGFTVIAAPGAEEALRMFNLAPARFSAVITDMMMPHMSGADLAAQLWKTAPKLPIITSSGLVPDAEPGGNSPPHGVSFVLPKPYTERALLDALAIALHQA